MPHPVWWEGFLEKVGFSLEWKTVEVTTVTTVMMGKMSLYGLIRPYKLIFPNGWDEKSVKEIE